MNWARIRELFLDVQDVAEHHRDEFLAARADDEVVREVRRLLDAQGASEGFLEAGELGLQSRRASSATAPTPGDRIGKYVLREKIGQGTFGSVWRAEQTDPVRREVALKLIRHGMQSQGVVARFEAERQALALMDCPYIAHVFDGGAVGRDQPYFVMELVRGEPITQFCDRKRLSIPRRLELFRDVCLAVQHAHHKGIMHRDLKPSNVLVSTDDDGRPVPKVIDFGIFAAIDDGEEERHLVGTPEYMSPEQAGLSDVDLRTDVYSLGVLLYALLTGGGPFPPAPLAELLRSVRELRPPKPSARVMQVDSREVAVERGTASPRSLARVLRGDLDSIVLRALEKDPGRRYDTASALADDVARHLAHEPVEAGSTSARYRVTKCVRRHPVIGAVAALGALAAAAVMSLSVQLLVVKRTLDEDLLTERAYARTVFAGRSLLYGDGDLTRAALEDVPTERRGWIWRLIADTPQHLAEFDERLLGGTVVYDLDLDADGMSFAATGGRGVVEAWDIDELELTWSRDLEEKPAHSLAFGSASQLAVGSGGGLVTLLAGATGEVLASARVSDHEIKEVDWLDGAVLAVSKGGEVVLLDASLESARRVAYVGAGILCARLSPDRRWLALGSQEGEVLLLDLDDGWSMQLATRILDNVLDLQFAPDGRFLLAVGRSDSAILTHGDDWRVTDLFPSPGVSALLVEDAVLQDVAICIGGQRSISIRGVAARTEFCSIAVPVSDALGFVSALEMTPSGRLIAAFGGGGVTILDVANRPTNTGGIR